MRSVGRVLPFCCVLLAVPAFAQQIISPGNPSQSIEPSQTSSPVAGTKDPQAINVLNQALTSAGGASAIAAIADYTATGNVTYHGNPEAKGTVTIRGLGLDQVRVDANLPRGMHSSIVSGGETKTKTEDGTVRQYPPPYPVPSSDAILYQPPIFPGSLVFPHAQLAAILSNPRFTISYKGIVQLDGKPVHEIEAEQVLPGVAQPASVADSSTLRFFVDASTLQVVMTQDTIPKHISHDIRYTDYKPVNGILMPFSISEEMGGQHTWTIQLGQFKFNAGLQDFEFALQ